MESSTIIAIAITAIILQCVILSWVISGATQTNKRIKYDEMQIDLLARIALKLDVDPDDVNKILNK